jgi:hypothetical protein
MQKPFFSDLPSGNVRYSSSLSAFLPKTYIWKFLLNGKHR